ncbi:HesA/MoeB/ThiF family protein [Mycolicibacterium austroafricanum]|uniref:HesA/MoeB/ThiF family protein n=1 Tax=Mycolicibacterium austroafricanum TaxID=39687 RepID=UPI000564874A|nr:ThiF family adenylyltransferase [Mycolicibacterium austroafricanum]QZY47024.1 ThiF family adenylyltransferase [Mycolicibacterium austroafricanum]
MYRSDPHIVLTRDGATKITSSTLTRGGLTMRHVPTDNLFVVHAVDVAEGTRTQVDIPREYTTLRTWGDQTRPAQWIRKPTETINIDHFAMIRRPGATADFQGFKTIIPRLLDPGTKYGILITHDPELTPELRIIGVSEYAGWLIHRDGVRPIHVEVQPRTIGIAQLAGTWPIERLAANSIMLVGCGSIGSAAAEALAGYGVGRVDLVDPDRFLWHNMLRHTLGPESVGRYKVSALQSLLNQSWPSQDVRAHRLDVVDDAHHIRRLIEDVDLILCTADGVAPRRVVSHLARRSGKPAVLACVLDHGAIGEIIRLRPSPRFGCLLCLRSALAENGAMDAEADQELDYGTGSAHQPMTAAPPDLRYVGTLAGKTAVATLLESLHGDHTQQLPAEHAIIGLHPGGDLHQPFDIAKPGDIRWLPIPPPRTKCPTCTP